jgi:hypothetical protein
MPSGERRAHGLDRAGQENVLQVWVKPIGQNDDKMVDPAVKADFDAITKLDSGDFVVGSRDNAGRTAST